MTPSTAPDLGGHVVFVGAGHAAGTAAGLLRQYGWSGPITMVGAEAAPPYQRPPLSKALLLGKMQPDELMLKPADFYAARNITTRWACRATALMRSQRRLLLEDGTQLAYDHLVLATGARLRPLEVPGATLEGVMSLRTLDDALALRARIQPGLRVAIVGGGYIGLEAAASARQLGAQVCVIERTNRLMARVASPELSDFVAGYAQERGVRLELDACVDGFTGTEGALRGIALADGRHIECDLALVGIGVLAEQELAQQSGLPCADGIVVDEQALTMDPAVSAIGDCTSRPVRALGRHMRLESVHNAIEQAKQVAARLCGRPAPAEEAPWTWSDQFDLRVQVAGFVDPGDEVALRGDPASGRFAIFRVSPAGELRCVEAVNAPLDFAFARMAIARRLRTPADRLRDAAVSLKEVALA